MAKDRPDHEKTIDEAIHAAQSEFHEAERFDDLGYKTLGSEAFSHDQLAREGLYHNIRALYHQNMAIIQLLKNLDRLRNY